MRTFVRPSPSMTTAAKTTVDKWPEKKRKEEEKKKEKKKKKKKKRADSEKAD